MTNFHVKGIFLCNGGLKLLTDFSVNVCLKSNLSHVTI